MKQVLLYLNEDIDFSILSIILEKHNMKFRVVEDQNLNDTIIDLFSDTNKKGNPSKVFPFSFILFKDCTKEEVFAFLKDFPFSHKAMLTQHNKNWTLQALLEEIKEEEAFFTSYRKLRNLIEEANSLDFKEYDEQSFAPYKDAILSAYVYLKTQKPEKDKIDFYIEQLTETKKNIKKRL